MKNQDKNKIYFDKTSLSLIPFIKVAIRQVQEETELKNTVKAFTKNDENVKEDNAVFKCLDRSIEEVTKSCFLLFKLFAKNNSELTKDELKNKLMEVINNHSLMNMVYDHSAKEMLEDPKSAISSEKVKLSRETVREMLNSDVDNDIISDIFETWFD